MVRRNNVEISSVEMKSGMIGSAHCDDEFREGRGERMQRSRVRLNGEGHEAVILGNVAFQNVGART